MTRETVWQTIWRVNRKVPIALGVLCLLNLVSYLILTGFVEKKAENLERLYISQQSEVRKAEQGGRSAESPLVVYARGTRDLHAFRQAIPPKTRLTGLVGEIFTLAESAGLKIDRISYQPELMAEFDLLQYSLDFRVNGNYNQIKKFTHKIEQSDRLISIDKMDLTSEEKSRRVKMQLQLTTFFREASQ